MTEPENKTAPRKDNSGTRSEGSAPLVFISHDSRDAELAEAFSKLLSSVSAGVLKSFRSSDRKGSQGIEYGVEWYPELMKNLGSAAEVVCLLTQRSLDRPWILYEAGVAKGKLDTPVHGVVLGIALSQANSGPFAQFQNCDGEEASLTKLVIQLLKRVPGADPDPEAIQMQVAAFKRKTNALLEQNGGHPDVASVDLGPAADTSSTAKLFEEIKVMFQDLPSRLESRLIDGPAVMRRRRSRRFHPMMFEELAHVAAREAGDPIGLLVLAGILREDFPWISEVVLEAYREAKAGSMKRARDTIRSLKHLSRMMVGGPWMEELGMSRDAEMMAMELPMLLDRYFDRLGFDEMDHEKETSARRKRPPIDKNGA